ncbi:MAG: hypothetical protein AB7C89_07480 [Intestinibacillus sp.]
MEFAVRQKGNTVGTAVITEDKRAVTFEVVCKLDTREVLRCFGVTEDPERPLLLGVLEPTGSGLSLRRTLTRQSLAAAGCTAIPQDYYLSGSALEEPEHPAPASASPPLPFAPPHSPASPRSSSHPTGDPLLDAAVATGGVRTERDGDTLRLLCPFDPEGPFPLAFAFACCRIEARGDQKYFVLELQGCKHSV